MKKNVGGNEHAWNIPSEGTVQCIECIHWESKRGRNVSNVSILRILWKHNDGGKYLQKHTTIKRGRQNIQQSNGGGWNITPGGMTRMCSTGTMYPWGEQTARVKCGTNTSDIVNEGGTCQTYPSSVLTYIPGEQWGRNNERDTAVNTGCIVATLRHSEDIYSITISTSITDIHKTSTQLQYLDLSQIRKYSW